MGYLKNAAFILLVFAIAKKLNNSVTIPVVSDFLPK